MVFRGVAVTAATATSSIKALSGSASNARWYSAAIAGSTRDDRRGLETGSRAFGTQISGDAHCASCRNPPPDYLELHVAKMELMPGAGRLLTSRPKVLLKRVREGFIAVLAKNAEEVLPLATGRDS